MIKQQNEKHNTCDLIVCRPRGAYYSPRYAEPLTPAIWERHQNQRRDSSQTSMSTFEEVESLDLSHSSSSQSAENGRGSRASIYQSSRGSMSKSFDVDMMASLETVETPRDLDSILQGAYGRSDPTRHHDYVTSALARYAMMRRYHSIDRQSSRSGSSRSRADSSWEEVESIDFGRQHEVDS